MITHVVCFKLKEGEDVAKAAQILRSMEGNVPAVLSITVGEDFLHSPRSYDIILFVRLASRQALDEYQKDGYHCSVVKAHMHAVTASSVAVDYEE